MSETIKLSFLSSKILKSKVLQNFSYLMAGSVISQALGMIALIKITRILIPADYGIYAFLLGQGFLLTTIGDLGVRSINMRTVAREPEKTKDLVVNGTKLRTIVLLISFLLYLVYNHFLGSL